MKFEEKYAEAIKLVRHRIARGEDIVIYSAQFHGVFDHSPWAGELDVEDEEENQSRTTTSHSDDQKGCTSSTVSTADDEPLSKKDGPGTLSRSSSFLSSSGNEADKSSSEDGLFRKPYESKKLMPTRKSRRPKSPSREA
ncbi:hypothetical protein BDB00DRAFT_868160 [Zychaea mexicana]|uniref:uncharacterized protein n=1 Tax=Zychaea mexicana TaxID=64656 RepID=UPI0022FDFF99|nr:uncharacterized protein BDB00DRAFT_868160 [Zychaea mexicana]KAI9497563.1 hypothetical protein BDB00DRAFT_868160 [Zychaea mexicana]